MKARNILSDIYQRILTPESAIAAVEEVLDSDDAEHVQKIFMLSRSEWTAFAQGASLSEVARWRHDGWPVNCAACELQIDVDKFRWRVVEAPNGRQSLSI